MNQYIPKEIFFTKGVGTHKEQLHSFELALRDAGIEKCNLVQVSSIMPPGCRIISRSEGLKKLQPGAITFCVMSRCCSDEPKRLISASVGCAIPVDKKAYGYISEHHAFGYTERQTGDYAEDLAAGREWVAAVVVRADRLPAARWAPAGVLIAAIRSRMNEACPARRFSARSAKHR